MHERSIAEIIVKKSEKYPVLAILGPRQTGKTTLARSLFSQLMHVTMEAPDTRQFAIDEVQRSPELLSYNQTIVGNPHNKRKFILTGSENLVLFEKISQSLAGRISLFNHYYFGNHF